MNGQSLFFFVFFEFMLIIPIAGGRFTLYEKYGKLNIIDNDCAKGMPEQLSEKAVVFKVNKEDYGVPISFVISIEKLPEVNPIPQLPSFVKGIVKVRDELIPVLDLEELLYGQELKKDEHSRMIVLKADMLSIGLFVREAKEIIDIPSDQLKKVALMGYQKTKFFSGVANLDNGLITMIDPNLLISSLEKVDKIQEYVEIHELV